MQVSDRMHAHWSAPVRLELTALETTADALGLVWLMFAVPRRVHNPFGRDNFAGGISPLSKVTKFYPRRNFRDVCPTTSLRIQMQVSSVTV